MKERHVLAHDGEEKAIHPSATDTLHQHCLCCDNHLLYFIHFQCSKLSHPLHGLWDKAVKEILQ